MKLALLDGKQEWPLCPSVFWGGYMLKQLEEALLSRVAKYKQLSEVRYLRKTREQLCPEKGFALKQG